MNLTLTKYFATRVASYLPKEAVKEGLISIAAYGGLLLAVVLSILFAGCMTLPVNMAEMTAAQLKAAASDKSAGTVCIVVAGVYGKAVAIYANIDQKVHPSGSTITVDAECKTTVNTGAQR